MKHLTSHRVILLPFLILAVNVFWPLSISDSAGLQKERSLPVSGKISIDRIKPDERGGKAYKLVYFVSAGIDVYWRFKTDFNNDFLVKNKYVQEHRFIAQNGDQVITEDKYTNGPDVYFRWQTTIFPQAKRLDFVLLNPKQCHQKFHYGYIQLTSVPQGTRVTQVAYFDFWGSALWAAWPWGGGMKDFLSYTARWEQKTIVQLKNRYNDKH